MYSLSRFSCAFAVVVGGRPLDRVARLCPEVGYTPLTFLQKTNITPTPNVKKQGTVSRHPGLICLLIG